MNGAGRSTLRLTNITAYQSGKYTVEVMNEHGLDVAAASVAVESIPEAPGGRPSVSQGPDRVSLAWCGPPYDGGCMLTGFVYVQYIYAALNPHTHTKTHRIMWQHSLEVKVQHGDWTVHSTIVDSLSCTLKDLQPGRTYRFRVRAENCHGCSEPSAATDDVRIGSLDEQSGSVTADELNEDTDDAMLANVAAMPLVREGGDFRSRFELHEELGKGRFGVVYRCVDRETDATLAAKIVKCIKSADKAKV